MAILFTSGSRRLLPLVAALACAFTQDSAACTGMYVGRKASTDGTTLLCRTMDYSPWEGTARICREPAGGKAKYANTTTPLITALGLGEFSGACMNEAGLMLTGTVTGYTAKHALAADPFVPKEKGVGEPNLPGMIIRSCATAREGVEFLGKTIAERGHLGAEIYMLADQDEAWYVEVYTGHQWAAVKMPEDKVACFGNQFMLGAFDVNSPEVRHSPGLVATAVKGGFDRWVDKAKGILDLRATYAEKLSDGANFRTWFGHRAFSPITAGAYSTSRRMDLFYAPDHKISAKEVFELMRSRYEGLPQCPDENDGTDIRVIGVAKQIHCHVLQMRHDLPPRFRASMWLCLAHSEHSVFLPLNASADHVAPAFARDQTEGKYAYDPERAGDAFLRLDVLSEIKRTQWDCNTNRVDVRPFFGDGVRAYWGLREKALLSAWPVRLNEAAKKDDPKPLTEFSMELQKRTWEDAKRLLGELQWYMTENNEIRNGAPLLPERPFWPREGK